MGRKNRNVRRSTSASRRMAERGDRPSRSSHGDHAIPRTPVEQMVMPDGICRRNSRKPKARFNTPEKAQKALEQAQRERSRTGSGHVEKRFYKCSACDGYHLTSLEAFEERGR